MSIALSQVAERAGVSKATASRALSGRGSVSEETRARVARAAADLGYVSSPNAASLVTGHTMSIGVLTPHHDRWFSGGVIEGAERELLAADYDMTLYTTRPDTADRHRIFDFFLPRKRFDGVLAIATEPAPTEVDLLARLGIPLVAVGGRVAGLDAVGLDDTELAMTATRHLVGLGHRRIAHLGGPTAVPWEFSVHRHRRDGFLAAMAEAGLSDLAETTEQEMTITDGFAAATAILSRAARPTAIFAACDELAIGATVAARRLGIGIPSELSIVGIDGHTLAPMFNLTTFEQSPPDQGTAAARLLLERIRGRGGPAEFLDAGTRFVLRSSTGQAPPDASPAGPA